MVLEPAAAAVLRACATLMARARLLDQLGSRFGSSVLADTFEMLNEQGLLLEEAGFLLSLPLRQPGLARAPAANAIGTVFFQSFASRSALNEEVVF